MVAAKELSLDTDTAARMLLASAATRLAAAGVESVEYETAAGVQWKVAI